ncbi:MAG: hypothetical protein EPN93_03935 [Spirochaetes bacterium]|nr:MAG: hypothetical protein EPN93_03935 [Spirochaetota bacterium]
MSVSSTHTFYVKELIKWLQQGNDGGLEYFIHCDISNLNLGNQPPRIDGFIPDVYAKARFGERIIIGEAKTLMDVESRHSKNQYISYLKHCSCFASSALLLAVPWTMVNCVKGLLKAIMRNNNIKSIDVIVLEYLPEQFSDLWDK